MTEFYEDIFLNKKFAFAPVEYLISLDVIGYNGNKSTKEFDLWPMVLLFAFIEGYSRTYYDYLYSPIKKLLKDNICIPV